MEKQFIRPGSTTDARIPDLQLLREEYQQRQRKATPAQQWCHSVNQATTNRMPESMLAYAAIFWGCLLFGHLSIVADLFASANIRITQHQQGLVFLVCAALTLMGAHLDWLWWRVILLFVHVALWSTVAVTFFSLTLDTLLVGLFFSLTLVAAYTAWHLLWQRYATGRYERARVLARARRLRRQRALAAVRGKAQPFPATPVPVLRYLNDDERTLAHHD